MFTGSFVAHTKRKDCWQCTSKKRDSVTLNKHSSTVGREEMNHILMCLCMPLSINFYFRLRFHMLYYTVVVNQSNAISLPSQKWTLTKKSIPLAADVYDNESISETDSQMNEGHFKWLLWGVSTTHLNIARLRIVFFFFFLSLWICRNALSQITPSSPRSLLRTKWKKCVCTPPFRRPSIITEHCLIFASAAKSASVASVSQCID